jgi:hypothetical protein
MSSSALTWHLSRLLHKLCVVHLWLALWPRDMREGHVFFGASLTYEEVARLSFGLNIPEFISSGRRAVVVGLADRVF